MARECFRCGKPYWRRNLTEVWTKRNPGARDGWAKTTLKLCNFCLPAPQAMRLLMVQHVTVGHRAQPVLERRRAER